MPDNLIEFAKKFGRPDIERLGIFIEMPYMRQKKKDKEKGAQQTTKYGDNLLSMLPGGPKTKCGNQDGYFDKEFRRVFAGDSRKQNIVTGASPLPFIPAGSSKKHSSPGDYYGTFSGTIPAFGRAIKLMPKRDSHLPNPMTNPGKKGGPGYIGITIGKYPEHKSERYKTVKTDLKSGVPKVPMILNHHEQPYFDPNPFMESKTPTKRLYIKPKEESWDKAIGPVFVPTGPGKKKGGCMAGGFSKWPEWKPSGPKFKAKSTGDIKGFPPHSYAEKTLQHFSTLYKTDFSMNATNWKQYEPKYVKNLLENVY